MPEQFDERWEYWEPDPEIVAVTSYRASLSASLPRVRNGSSSELDGFRIGLPNSCSFRLAKEKVSHKPEPPRWKMVLVDCPGCGSIFRRKRRSQIACSFECAASTNVGSEPQFDIEKLKQLTLAGAPPRVVAKKLGCCKYTVLYWKRKLNLPPCTYEQKFSPQTLTLNGVTMSVPRWAVKLRVDENVLYRKIKMGLSAEEILTGTKPRKLIKLTYMGRSLTMGQWEKVCGIKRCVLRQRWAKGWPIEKVFKGAKFQEEERA